MQISSIYINICIIYIHCIYINTLAGAEGCRSGDTRGEMFTGKINYVFGFYFGDSVRSLPRIYYINSARLCCLPTKHLPAYTDLPRSTWPTRPPTSPRIYLFAVALETLKMSDNGSLNTTVFSLHIYRIPATVLRITPAWNCDSASFFSTPLLCFLFTSLKKSQRSSVPAIAHLLHPYPVVVHHL